MTGNPGIRCSLGSNATEKETFSIWDNCFKKLEENEVGVRVYFTHVNGNTAVIRTLDMGTIS